jgi:acyl-coenzyme A synthetase/AMP-(fatty) acid ligase
VTEAAVVARPDELRGELVVSCVVPTGASGAPGEFPGGAVNTL